MAETSAGWASTQHVAGEVQENKCTSRSTIPMKIASSQLTISVRFK